MNHPGASTPNSRAELPAVLGFTLLCSFGTGVVWSGMPFIAEHDYQFSQILSLLLFLFLGVTYTGAALASGRLIRRVQQRVSARGILGLIVLVQAGVCMVPWWVNEPWVIWFVIGLTSLLSALLWPVVESYVTAGRHGNSMRSALGWWNVTWTLAVAISLVAIAPLMAGEGQTARFAIVALGGLNLMAVVALRWFRPHPTRHDHEQASDAVGPEYHHLLRSARVMLPVSYLLVGTISPLMPYLLDNLEVTDGLKTPMTATWMFARVLALVLMWRLRFWHGRWGVLLLGGVMLAGGFGMMVAAATTGWMHAGLVVFGVGQGITYYLALYYAMAVGRSEVDAAGKHEGLIGVGYAAGPLTVLVALWLAAQLGLPERVMMIGTVELVLAVCFVLALRPYLVARRNRPARTTPTAPI